MAKAILMAQIQKFVCWHWRCGSRCGAADQRDDNADQSDDDADWHDDDTVVDVEGGESDGTAKNSETELSMRMFCKYCCKYEKAGSFVVGSPVFQLEGIKAHNSSPSHIK